MCPEHETGFPPTRERRGRPGGMPAASVSEWLRRDGRTIGLAGSLTVAVLTAGSGDLI